jgi:CDP-glucose 4,6-dehydratase
MYRWEGRRVLVTGATGIVGGWLCEEVVKRGAYVTALVLDDEPVSRFYGDGIYQKCSVVRGDLTDFSACMRALNVHEAEVVFHLGAQTIVGAAMRDPLECFESNIRGTYNILEAVRRLPSLAIRVIVASSDKAYGDSPTLPYREEMPLKGVHPYDVSKSCTDLLSQAYAHTYGMNLGIARCGNIYGGGDLNWSRIVPGTIRALLSGQAPVLRSDGTMIRDYTYVKDVVSAYLTMAEQLHHDDIRGQAFNFSPGTQISVREIVDTIARVMGVHIEPVVLSTARMEIQNQTLDATKAKELLSWTCSYELEDALSETVAWYRSHFSRTAMA